MRHKRSRYLVPIFTVIGTLFSVSIFASISQAAPLYTPGETLNPTCSPTDPDCTVATSIFPTITATSTTATSTFAGPITANSIFTFGGITGATQCLHVDASGVVSGTGSDCGSGSGAGTVNTGSTGQIAFYNSSGTAVSGTSTITLANGNVGIGTTTPIAALQVNARAAANSPAAILTDGLADVSNVKIQGYNSVLSLAELDGTNDYQLGYISNAYGKIANYQTTGNTLEFDHVTNTDTWKGSNYLLPYGGVSFGQEYKPSQSYGTYLYGSSVVGIGAVTDLSTASNNNPTMVIDAGTGRVGVGTTSPAYKLDVGGDVNIAAGHYYRYDGSIVLSALPSLSDYFFGGSAGNMYMTGGDNTAEGFHAMWNNTTGNYNTANGSNALAANTTGYRNTANGAQALNANTSGYQNTTNGFQALYSNTTGYSNTANGVQALYSNTNGLRNTVNGYGALYSNTTGNDNSVNGTKALYYNSLANENVAVGSFAGYGSLGSTASQGNVFLGYQSGYYNTTGNNNTLIGYQSGYHLTNGSNNIIIGQNVDTTALSANDTLNIGNLIYGKGIYSGSTLSSSPTAGDIGIGTSSPSNRLEVAGNTFIAGNLTATGTVTNLGVGADSQINFGAQQGYIKQVSTLVTIGAEGQDVATFGKNTGLSVTKGGIIIQNNTGSYKFGSSADTSLNRLSAGVVGVGSSGTTDGTLIAGNVGIGTTTSNAQLSVVGVPGSNVINIASSSGSSLFTIDSAGNTTFGSGSLYFSAGSHPTIDYIKVQNGAESLAINGYYGVRLNSQTTSEGVDLQVGGQSKLKVTNSGVGIGTTSPISALAVVGTTTTSGLTISNLANTTLAVDANGNVIATTTTGGGSGTVNSGTAGQVAFYDSTGTAVSGTSTLFFNNGNVGIGTTSPYAKLSVVGAVVADSFNATNTTATSSFAGNVTVGGPYVYASNNSLAGGVGTATCFVGCSYSRVIASGVGSLAWGFSNQSSGSDLSATNSGSIALGAGGLSSSGIGSIAVGYSDDHIGGTISSTGSGSFAGGYSGGGPVTASGDGSFAFGNNVVSSGSFSTSFGSGFTNNAANTFQVGYSSTPTLTVNATGVGIGTTSPISALAVVGTTTLNGNVSISGSIIPTADNTYSLGAASSTWKDVFVGPGSIYVNGQEVLHTDPSKNVNLSADLNQDVIVQTSGTGDIQLNPSGTGNILLKGNVQLYGGKTFTTSDGSALSFVDGLKAGNISITGNDIIATTTNGSINLAANGLGAVYVSNGNFGIGTTSPGSALTVNGDVNFTGALKTNGVAGANGYILQSTGSGVQWVATSSLGIGGSSQWTTSGSDISYVSGNVGIGTTSPLAKLSVKGSGTGSGVSFEVTNSSDASLFKIQDNGTVSISIPGQALGTSFSAAGTGVNITSRSFSTQGGAAFTGSGLSGISSLSMISGATITSAGDLNLTPSGNSLFTAGNVGIGTTTPGSTLTIQGSGSTNALTIASSSGSTLFTIDTSGNVGIGTNSPSSINGHPTLSINGNLNVTGPNGGYGNIDASGANIGSISSTKIGVSTIGGDTGVTSGTSWTTTIGNNYNAGSAPTLNAGGLRIAPTYGVAGGIATDLYIGGTTEAATSASIHRLIDAGNSSTNRFVLLSNGDLGIGTTSPTHQLEVAGDAYIAGNVTATGTLTLAGLANTVLAVDANGNVVATTTAGGSGTVNSGTAGQVAFYNSTGTAVSGTSTLTTSGGDIYSSGNVYVPYNYSVGFNASNRINFGSGIVDVYAGHGTHSFLRVTGSYVTVPNNSQFGWSSGVSASSPDTALSRLSANTVAVGNGTAGDYSGTLVASNVGIGTSTPLSSLDVNGGVAIGSYAGAYAAPTNGMIISGTLGVGKSNPSGAYSIDTASGVNVQLLAVNGNQTLTTSGNNLWVKASSGKYIAFAPNGGGTAAAIVDSTGNFGIGTTSPISMLSVVGDAYLSGSFTVATTTATSTIAGSLDVGNGLLSTNYGTGVTSISSLNTGAINFDTDAGMISWTDLPISSAASSTVESYSAQIAGNPVLTVYGLSNGAGNANTLRVGIGSTTPSKTLSIEGSFAVNSPGATSTITGNLDVAGNVHGTNVYSGDLIFKNNFHFTEASTTATTTPGGYNGLYLTNQNLQNIMSIDEQGNLSVKGDVCANGTDCYGATIQTLTDRLQALASSTAQASVSASSTTASLLTAQSATNLTLGQLSEALITTNSFVNANTDRIHDLATTIASLSASSTFLDTIASSTATKLASSTSFISVVATAVKNVIAGAGDWAVSKITATLAVFDRVETNSIETQTATVDDGIQMIDTHTGQIYCLRITDGNITKYLGTCAATATSTVVTATTTTTNTTTSTINTNTQTTPSVITQPTNQNTLITNTVANISTTSTDSTSTGSTSTGTTSSSSSITDATTTVATSTDAATTTSVATSTTVTSSSTATTTLSIATTTTTTVSSVATSTDTTSSSVSSSTSSTSTVTTQDTSASSTPSVSNTPTNANTGNSTSTPDQTSTSPSTSSSTSTTPPTGASDTMTASSTTS